MARRRGRRRGRKSFKLPIVTLAILAGQAGVAIAGSGGDWKNAASSFASYYSGFNIQQGRFDAPSLIAGWGPWIVKGFVSRVARGMGATPKIPFGLPVSLS